MQHHQGNKNHSEKKNPIKVVHRKKKNINIQPCKMVKIHTQFVEVGSLSTKSLIMFNKCLKRKVHIYIRWCGYALLNFIVCVWDWQFTVKCLKLKNYTLEHWQHKIM